MQKISKIAQIIIEVKSMKTFINKIKNESIEYGSIPFWSWNDKLEEKRLKEQIQDMHDIKMNGYFMHARFGLETEYMSDEWFDAIRVGVEEGKKLNMQAWSYDENGWPSGFAGGELLKDEKNWARFLDYTLEKEFKKEALGVYIKENETLKRVFNSEKNIEDKDIEYITIWQKHDSSYVDTMDIEVTKRFIESTYQRYKDELGDDFGTSMPGFFTDEPQYYRNATTWSLKMPHEFKKAYGYDVLDKLPALFIDFEGAEEFRYDYWYLCHNLFTNNFIKPLYEWCEENGCQLTGHAVEENTLWGQMWCCGGVMPFYEYQHIPGIDYLGRRIGKDIPAKQVGSVAAQLGKKKVLSEMFGCCGWDVSPLELKLIGEYQYASGVNLMCQHLYPISERGQRKRDYPAHYSEHSSWHKKLESFNEYFNRLGYTLSRGEERANVLCIHPMHSAYLKYKRKEDYLTLEELNKAFNDTTDLLCQNQISYHLGDEVLMRKYGSVEGDKIKVGLCSYDYIVLPLTYTLDSSTVKLLKKYLANGGKLFIHGNKPQRIDGRIQDMSWLEANVTFEDIINSAFIQCSLNKEPAKDIRVMVRDTEYGRLYYILNLSYEELKNVDVNISTSYNSEFYLLDLEDLSTKVMDIRQVAKQEAKKDMGKEQLNSSFSLNFDPGESFILIEETKGLKDDIGSYFTESKNYFTLPTKSKLALSPQNAFVLDYAQISYDGLNYERLRPIPLIRDLLLNKRHKGPLHLLYSFTVDEIPQSLSLAVEPMNQKSVKINGNLLDFTNSSSWFDKSFKSVDIADFIKIGNNEVSVEIDYYQDDYVYYVLYGGVSESLRNCLTFDTEIEAVYLFGNFELSTKKELFTPEHRDSFSYLGTFAIKKQKDYMDLNNIVVDGYPFFAGTIEVEKEYRYKAGMPTTLLLKGRYSAIDVWVNDEFAGSCMFKNYLDLCDYLKEGTNQIYLKLYNSNRNLMGPHHALDPEPISVSPYYFSFEGHWKDEKCSSYLDRYAFVRFGID